MQIYLKRILKTFIVHFLTIFIQKKLTFKMIQYNLKTYTTKI